LRGGRLNCKKSKLLASEEGTGISWPGDRKELGKRRVRKGNTKNRTNHFDIWTAEKG